MPAKPPAELTQVEVTILGTAARLFAALHSYAEHPPVAELQPYYNEKVLDEIVSTYIALHAEGT